MPKRHLAPALLISLLLGIAAGFGYSARQDLTAVALTEAPDPRTETEPAPVAATPTVAPCLPLTAVTRVFAVGSQNGRELPHQIDDSGMMARQLEVVVNSPDTPVALMLGNVNPTIWRIRWTAGTKVAAVALSGVHRQVVAGLSPDVPVLQPGSRGGEDCASFVPFHDEPERANTASLQFFGKSVSAVVLGNGPGPITVGDAVAPGTDLLSSAAETAPEAYFKPKGTLAGPAGLADAVAAGQIRELSPQEAATFRAAITASKPAYIPYRSYLVLGPFAYPPALGGARAASFFIPKGVPVPSGDPGHSAVYDLNTGSCRSFVPGSCPVGANRR